MKTNNFVMLLQTWDFCYRWDD